MQVSSTDAASKLIWSADVPDVAAVEAKLDELSGLRVVKIDRLFVDTNGWDVFDMLRGRDIKAFDDAKAIEIPSKLEGIAKTHLKRAQPWMLNCMAHAVSTGKAQDEDPEKLDGLKRFADACNSVGTLPCAVTVLTSKAKDIVLDEAGRDSTAQVLFYTELLVRFGFKAVVCSPQETAVLHREFEDSLLYVNPGIRPAGSDVGDQARIATPAGALANGADYLVIGRPLKDKSSFDAIVEEMSGVTV